MRALVVDDLNIARRLIVNNLTGLGFDEILEAEDGLMALQLIQNEKEEINIIITDWLMPNMDGLEFISELKKFERFKPIPILMVTSVDEKSEVLKAIKSGVNDYIAKPYTPETIRNKVEWMLRMSKDYLLK